MVFNDIIAITETLFPPELEKISITFSNNPKLPVFERFLRVCEQCVLQHSEIFLRLTRLEENHITLF